MSSNKTIAKNTLFLYVRMMFTMLVALYTSRVILHVLGIDDYGIYQTVGGVVLLLSFLNGALSAGSSRFLTYELGKGDFDKLQKTFSTVLSIHIILAVLILLIAETVGVWFIYNKLVIPPERMEAAVFAYHLSILTAIVSITQIPYNASIISHERMSIYAYLSIIEVTLKLGVVYLLIISNWDKLKVYALLICIVQISVALFYRFYCTHHFNETKYRLNFDRSIMKQVLSYSGWNIFANMSIAITTQGAIILINMFFSPIIVTARAIADQVNMAANQFVQNFRIAVNPQIVKLYAVENHERSKQLLLASTKYSYYMMLALCLPICLSAEPLLKLWLGIIPEYTVIFLQIAVVTSLFQVFDTSFYTALYAKGQIRENAIISPLVLFMAFPIVYILFRLGYRPESLAWVMLACYAILGLLVKPMLLIKIVDYKKKDIVNTFIPCLKVTFVAVPLPCLLYYYRDVLFPNGIIHLLLLSSICIACVGLSVWFTGLDKEMKAILLLFVKRRFKHLRA